MLKNNTTLAVVFISVLFVLLTSFSLQQQGKELAQRLDDVSTGKRLFGYESNNEFVGSRFFLITTLDGQLHSVDVESGEVKWSVDTKGGPLLTSSSTANVSQYMSGENHDETSEYSYFMIPSINGNLYAYVPGKMGLEKLPVNIRELVDLSPFYAIDGTLYISNKQTSVFVVRSDTGEFVCQYESALGKSNIQQQFASSCINDQYAEQDLIFMIRVDYAVHALDSQSGLVKWNVTFSDIYPSKLTYSQDSSERPLAFSTSDGQLYFLAHPHGIPQVVSFDAQPVSVYQQDVYQPDEFQKVNMPTLVNQITSSSPSPLRSQPRVYVRTSDFGSSNGYLYAFELPVDYALHTKKPVDNQNNQEYILQNISEKFQQYFQERADDNSSSHQLVVGSANRPTKTTVPSEKPGKLTILPSGESGSLVIRDMNDLEGVHHISPFTQGQCLSREVIYRYSRYNFEDDEDIQHGNVIYPPEYGNDNLNKPPRIKPSKKERYISNLEIVLILVIIIMLVSFGIYRKKAESQGVKFEEPAEEVDEEPAEEIQSPTAEEKQIVVEAVVKDGYARVGKLYISYSKVLGRGSNGTVVYEGELDGRRVAVKRMLRDFYDIASKEISLLIQSDQHVNVVRYFAKEEDEMFVYLALEYCPYTLSQLFDVEEEQLVRDSRPVAASAKKVENNLAAQIGVDKRVLLSQLIESVVHIHQLGIVHRDLKPGNILLSSSIVVKLSDMGLGKVLDKNKSSFHTTIGGTLGWQAPEALKQNARLTRSVDIFALGCIIYYVYTDGEHPFGENYQREANILKNKFNIQHKAISLELAHLIEQMICADPKKRISAQEVLRHPSFWSDEKKMDFLCDVSDQLGKEKQQSIVYQKLESLNKIIFCPEKLWNTKKKYEVILEWHKVLDSNVIDNAEKFRKYDHTKVWDLLRLIRNIRSHFREYDEELQKMMRPIPEGILSYFCNKYPNLFYQVYINVKQHWREKENFTQYF